MTPEPDPADLAAPPPRSEHLAESLGRARSALITALSWKRRDGLCERLAHDALVAAFEARDATLAADLVQGHLVDLVSWLDLGEKPAAPASLRQALGGLA